MCCESDPSCHLLRPRSERSDLGNKGLIQQLRQMPALGLLNEPRKAYGQTHTRYVRFPLHKVIKGDKGRQIKTIEANTL